MFTLLASVPFIGPPEYGNGDARWLIPNGGREHWGDEPWALALGEGPYERVFDSEFDYRWAPGAL